MAVDTESRVGRDMPPGGPEVTPRRRRRGGGRVQARGVGLPTWFWQTFAAPGLVWLVLLFLVPFYTVIAVAFGARDPIFLSPIPVYNPISWDPATFQSVLGEIVGGGPLQVVVLDLRWPDASERRPENGPVPSLTHRG